MTTAAKTFDRWTKLGAYMPIPTLAELDVAAAVATIRHVRPR